MKKEEKIQQISALWLRRAKLRLELQKVEEELEARSKELFDLAGPGPHDFGEQLGEGWIWATPPRGEEPPPPTYYVTFAKRRT